MTKIPKAIFKKTQGSKVGDVPTYLFFINNYHDVSFGPMFLFVHMICVILGAYFLLFTFFLVLILRLLLPFIHANFYLQVLYYLSNLSFCTHKVLLVLFSR